MKALALRPGPSWCVYVGGAYVLGTVFALLVGWVSFAARQPILGLIPSGGVMSWMANGALLCAAGWTAGIAAAVATHPFSARAITGAAIFAGAYFGTQITQPNYAGLQWIFLTTLIVYLARTALKRRQNA